MSFQAKSKGAGKDYHVLDCKYDLHQEVDKTGRPSSVKRGGRISLMVESTGENDLFEWKCDNYATKEGSGIYSKRDSDATMKEPKLKDAYMVFYNEKFSASTEAPMRISFTLSAREITLGNGHHTNAWPDAGGSNGGR